MNTFPSDPNWPTVTVVSRPGDLEPRWRDDAAVVGSAVFAAMRPDRLIPAWIVLMLLRLLGAVGHAAGIGERMLPGNPIDAWRLWREGRPATIDAAASDPLGGLLHGVLLVVGGMALVMLSAVLVRLDAERLGRDRDLPTWAGLRWAIASWRRLVGAVLLPPVLAFLLSVPAILLALPTRVPVLDVVVAVLWIVPLVPAFAGALLGVAWLVSLPFIVPAAACEGGDPVETTVRVASLLRRRFPRTLAMVTVAIASGLVAWLLVAGVAVTTVGLASIGLGESSAPSVWSFPTLAGSAAEAGTSGGEDPGIAARVIDWWHAGVMSLAFAWALGFVLLASGRILLVVRRVADRLPFDDLGEPGPE